MNNKLIIVTDLGLLKAYRLETTPRGTPRLGPIEQVRLEEAHRRLLDEVADLAGRHVSPTQHKWGAPMADDHNLRLELRRRLIKQIARHTTRLARESGCDGVWLVAHKEIGRPIFDELPAPVRRRVEKTIPRDLVKAGQRELLQALKPHVSRGQPANREESV